MTERHRAETEHPQGFNELLRQCALRVRQWREALRIQGRHADMDNFTYPCMSVAAPSDRRRGQSLVASMLLPE